MGKDLVPDGNKYILVRRNDIIDSSNDFKKIEKAFGDEVKLRGYSGLELYKRISVEIDIEFGE